MQTNFNATLNIDIGCDIVSLEAYTQPERSTGGSPTFSMTLNATMDLLSHLLQKHIATFGAWHYQGCWYVPSVLDQHIATEDEEAEGRYIAFNGSAVQFLAIIEDDVPPVAGAVWVTAAEFIHSQVCVNFLPRLKRFKPQDLPDLVTAWAMDAVRPWSPLMANITPVKGTTMRQRKLHGWKLMFRDFSELVLSPEGVVLVAQVPTQLQDGIDTLVDLKHMPYVGTA